MGKSRRKGFNGQKKGSSEKPSRRDYQLLSITISAPSLPPYEKFTPILKRKAPRFRILKKCMTRLEEFAMGQLTQPWCAWQKRASTKWSFHLGWGSRPERIFFKTFSPMLNFLYITLFWNALEFYGRLGHVPWREVSSHLIALIAGISKKDAPPLIHIKIFVKLGPDEGWEWLNTSARTQVSNWPTIVSSYRPFS